MKNRNLILDRMQSFFDDYRSTKNFIERNSTSLNEDDVFEMEENAHYTIAQCLEYIKGIIENGK